MSPVPEEYVTWAYRLLLERDPESAAQVKAYSEQMSSTGELRAAFLLSQEFGDRNRFYIPSIRGNEPPMDVQVECNPVEMAALIAHIQEVWTRLGRDEPHWSVLSAARFKAAQVDAHRDEFEASGARDMQRMLDAAARNGIELDPRFSCLELGCGLGRVTRFLAGRFARVVALDISAQHLDYARRYLAGLGIDNVETRHLGVFDDVARMPRADVAYSVIVLQHNPPPLILAAIKGILAAVQPGGFAYFQVPTYRRGYRFHVKEYLHSRQGGGEIEMHVLPQAQVFQALFAYGFCAIEVIEDGYNGNQDLSSTTFFARRIRQAAK